MSRSLTTWQVLLQRRAAVSRPGARTDGARVALVIEGGGNRAAYSAGMCIALEQAALVDSFDAVYGTSGGALNGAWLLTREGERWLPLWATEEYAAEKVSDVRRVLRGGPVVDLVHLLHHVYVHVAPMDFATILGSPISLHPVATDALTGAATDLASLIQDQGTLQTALRATSSLPFLAGRPVELAGRRFVDGGVAEPVPVRTALDDGATHVLVLRTRRADQTVIRPSLGQRLVMSAWMLARAPGARRPYLRRHEAHLKDEAFLECFTVAGTVQQVRPPSGSADVTRLTGDLQLVATALETGRVALLEQLKVESSAEDARPEGTASSNGERTVG